MDFIDFHTWLIRMKSIIRKALMLTNQEKAQFLFDLLIKAVREVGKKSATPYGQRLRTQVMNYLLDSRHIQLLMNLVYLRIS